MGYTVISDGRRLCITCRVTKELSEFGSYAYTTKQGKPSRRHSSRCRVCELERSRLKPRKTDRKCPRAPKAQNPENKVCSRCLVEQPKSNFYPLKRGGLRSWCRGCQCRSVAQYIETHRENSRKWVRAASIRKKYGLEPDEYDGMVRAQGGLCAACREPGDRMHVDHCHATGVIRGLLCRECNLSLGWAKDSPDRLRKLALYLEGDFPFQSTR